eukprot:3592923-Rhodomonas_salina.1
MAARDARALRQNQRQSQVAATTTILSIRETRERSSQTCPGRGNEGAIQIMRKDVTWRRGTWR